LLFAVFLSSVAAPVTFARDPAVPTDWRGRELDATMRIKRKSELFLANLASLPRALENMEAQSGKRAGPLKAFSGWFRLGRSRDHYETVSKELYREVISAKWNFFDQSVSHPQTLLPTEQTLAARVKADLAGKPRPHFGRGPATTADVLARDPFRGRTPKDWIEELRAERKKYLGTSE